jgi:hypothetical protein
MVSQGASMEAPQANRMQRDGLLLKEKIRNGRNPEGEKVLDNRNSFGVSFFCQKWKVYGWILMVTKDGWVLNPDYS